MIWSDQPYELCQYSQILGPDDLRPRASTTMEEFLKVLSVTNGTFHWVRPIAQANIKKSPT